MNKSINLKSIFTIITLLLIIIVSNAQGSVKLDEVPHDISYYRESKVTKPLAKVIYGRPSYKDTAEVFGTKIPFNELWRTGANEATEIRFYDDVRFGDVIVSAGTYVLYTIPGENEWEIILSSNTDVLGAFQYDPLFDVAKIKVPVSKAEKLETFTISFKKQNARKTVMSIAWGSTRVYVPVGFNESEYYTGLFDHTSLKFSN